MKWLMRRGLLPTRVPAYLALPLVLVLAACSDAQVATVLLLPTVSGPHPNQYGVTVDGSVELSGSYGEERQLELPPGQHQVLVHQLGTGCLLILERRLVNFDLVKITAPDHTYAFTLRVDDVVRQPFEVECSP
jgi:hypothetical protein